MKKHSGYRKRENNYAEITPDSWGCIIVIIIFSRLGWSAVQAPGLITNDSRDYIAFDTAALFQGQMINGRPPLYGMFLDLLEWIFGTRFLSAAVAIQMLLSLGTLILFAKILSMIEIGAPWKQIGVLLYGVSPGVVGWDSCILTESFSLSGTVLFLYLMIRYLKKREFAYAMGGLAVTVLLIFLRPQFMVYLALLTVFCILKWFFPADSQERKTILFLGAGIGVTVLLLLGYSWQFERQFGVFSLTDATPRQDLVICIDRGYYPELDDAEVAQFLQEELEQGASSWDSSVTAVERFGNERIGRTTKNYFARHLSQYLRDTIDTAVNDLQSRFIGYALGLSHVTEGLQKSGIICKLYYVQVGLFGTVSVMQVLLVTVLEGLAMVVAWVRRRSLPWIHMLFFSAMTCTTFLTYFVTCGEYMRTMVSALPYAYIVFFLFLQFCSTYSYSLRKGSESNDLR